jgi:hypothetical protein
MGQFGHPCWEDDMTHNSPHGIYMFDHLNMATITLQNVEPFAHEKKHVL